MLTARLPACASAASWHYESRQATSVGGAGSTLNEADVRLNFVNSVTSFIAALTGTALSDKIGRRKLLLFAETACACGMAIVAGLISSSSTSAVRGHAGISFICEFCTICMSLIIALTDRPLHGVLQLWIHPPSRPVSRRVPCIRESSEGYRAADVGRYRVRSHQHIWHARGASQAQVEE